MLQLPDATLYVPKARAFTGFVTTKLVCGRSNLVSTPVRAAFATHVQLAR